MPTADGGLRAGVPMDALRNNPLPLPERLRRAEAHRIELLGPDARHLFDVLVVLDMEATIELVGEIAASDPHVLGRALRELSTSGLIRERAEGVHQVVSLRGDRNREVAYQLIAKDKRTQLHQTVAASLRRRSRRRSGTFAEVIASHLLSGGQVGEAYPMLLVAAETTLRAGRNRQTIKLLEKAERARTVASSAEEPNTLHRYERRLCALWGNVHLRMNKPREAMEAWQSSMAAARLEGDVEAVARAQAGVGLSRVALGEVAAASSGLEQALSVLPQGDPMWAQAAESLAGARLSRGDIDGSQRLWSELLELGREMGAGSVHARAMAGLGVISMVRGKVDVGRDNLENAVFRMRDQPPNKMMSESLLRLAELAHAEGRLEAARGLARDADAAARDLPHLPVCVAALGLAARCLRDIGVPHEARLIAQDAATMSRSMSQIETVGDVGFILPSAGVLVALGATDEAAALLPNIPTSKSAETVGIDDPVGGLLAIKSRVVLERNPTVAVALARQVLDRNHMTLGWARARQLLDAGFTLAAVSDARAREAVTGAIKAVSDSRFKLLRMEAGLLAERLGMSGEWVVEAHQILDFLDHQLGSPEGFRDRWLG